MRCCASMPCDAFASRQTSQSYPVEAWLPADGDLVRLASDRSVGRRDMDSCENHYSADVRHLVWILGYDASPEATDRAACLLHDFESLGALLAASADRQLKTARYDEGIAGALRSFNDALVHVLRSRLPSGPLLSNCSQLHDYLRATLSYSPIERFRVFYLDTAKRLIRDEVIASGTVDRVAIHCREIIRRAIDLDATALILVHNHPGGSLTPSASDTALTSRIGVLTTGLGIELVDHLIVANDRVISLRQLGLLS